VPEIRRQPLVVSAARAAFLKGRTLHRARDYLLTFDAGQTQQAYGSLLRRVYLDHLERSFFAASWASARDEYLRRS